MAETEDAWTAENEKEWKEQIAALFSRRLQEALTQYGDPLTVGNRLGDVLRSVESEAVQMIVPRAVRKRASKQNLPHWEEILKDETMLVDLRDIGTSIANTLRPQAGNTFTKWIASVLNLTFDQQRIPLRCVTKGKVKSDLSERLVVHGAEGRRTVDYKPDMDIVVVHLPTSMPLAILSAKTTLAERVMQTITWKRYKDQLPQNVRNVRLYLVTAWWTS
ncbi:BsaWI family type II restriction enzyme [Candidatus Acetothermia bacterium]|jgi:hypothetical protein|nr:BsaWI family type II restriction enzyme [Candidatus Acetothermia bacterium]MCI2432547.1 BsaWI family type II restriction enzyme [Candidatus Acetothermia bacterium]MCI2435876.1 BsaWI family type II restriction enzyme [Candidatus Acetothermia bacterium]